MAPSACTIDYNVLKTILTTTVSSLADEAYAVNDYESIVATYEAFFLGVAQLSDRLNAAPLRRLPSMSSIAMPLKQTISLRSS